MSKRGAPANPLVWPPREWPKTAFPEHYAWPAVAARARAVASGEAWQLASAQFRSVVQHDPLAHIFYQEKETAPEADFPLFRWIPGSRDDRPNRSVAAWVMTPLMKPAEVVTLVGTAGAEHGSGGPTIVRFVLTLSQFADFKIVALGEDAIEFELAPKWDWCPDLIAMRVLQIAPRTPRTAAELAREIAAGSLKLSYA